MTSTPDRPAASYLEANDILLVMRPGSGRTEDQGDELFLAIEGSGAVVAFNGHVDLGTGIRTALAQIVAEELGVAFAEVRMVLGSTAAAPDQGPTIASETIQVTAKPLRQAAATARAYLVERASNILGVPAADLHASDGAIRSNGDKNIGLSYAELVAGEQVRLVIDRAAALKPTSEYTIVGRSQPRVDIPGKATGNWAYVHDVRVPGMLHGRVVRPPYGGIDSGPHVGTSLMAVDETSVADIPGLVAVVTVGDFVGVVARREEDAHEAMLRLKVTWRPAPVLPNLNAPEAALRDNPSTPRRLADRGDVEKALAATGAPMDRTYVWPYQMHGSIGPSCAVADYRADGVTVWSGTQNPFPLRADLALLLDLPEERVVVERLEAAGCYGRNCADDVSADAALLSRAVGRPVRVQLTREQEHVWEPKGAAQVMDVRGGLDLDGGPTAYDFETRYPSNSAPTLALLLTGAVSSAAVVTRMGDRTAIPPYAYGNLRVTVHDMPPIARASWFRGVSAMPNTFAHESFIDELATAAGVDPIAYRLRYLTDPRAIDLVKAVAERAEWVPHTSHGSHGGGGDMLYGRGFAYAVYVHGEFPGKAAAWAAWVADVAVNKVTGEIAVTRVVAGQDSGQIINPDGVLHQIHGNVLQSTSRVLKEQVGFSTTAVTSREWGAYPILSFSEVPAIDVLLMDRPDDPPLGVGESASVPSAAAIANAIFDATGIRIRELPITPERMRAALNPLPPPEAAAAPASAVKSWWPWRLPLLGAFSGALAIAVTAMPWQFGIAPIAPPGAGVFSAATIEHGRLVAAAGDCNVCHEGTNGVAFAGGRPLDTPFGTVYAVNITPDPVAGIGAWSYPAFERAMRRGVSRDGHYLYPAHPYTAFAKASEADLEALYAYLMTVPASASTAPATALRFPFNLRPLMAAWNTLFLPGAGFAFDATRSAEWNRGAELVEGLGHCGACHTERNLLGAEQGGPARLAGGSADGWDAPSLTARNGAPVPWTEEAFYQYLRHGWSPEHSAASGPMAHVIDSMGPLPDADLRAMASYLVSLNPDAPAAEAGQMAAVEAIAASEAAVQTAFSVSPAGARIFAGACSSCHSSANQGMVALALNSNLHGARPDNLVQAILNGVAAPPAGGAGAVARGADGMAMPAFANALDAEQIADLAAYMRARFAPGQPAWSDVDGAIARVAKSLEGRN